MSHKILLTGASGYLGGTLLARWKAANLPAHSTLYALVRSDEQAKKVKVYGAEPLTLDFDDPASVTQTILDKEITIIYFLIDAYRATRQQVLIEALGAVKRQTGKEVHFLHTAGAKQFSRHAGVADDRPLLDTDPGLYDIEKRSRSPYEFLGVSVQTNIAIIDTAEANDVRSYIFVPCLVYGKGEGFGNPTSIQDVDIVRSAIQLRRVYSVDSDDPIWPVCHISDTADLYLHILSAILSGRDIGHGKNGFYLAASGSVRWNDVYRAMAKELAKRNVIDDEAVLPADVAIREKMGKALGVPGSTVPVLLGGRCAFTAAHGREIGWTPRYAPEHILEVAGEEVELILQTLEGRQKRPDVR